MKRGLLTTIEAASVLKCSATQLARTRGARPRMLYGYPPPEFIRFPSGTVRYRLSDIEAWLEKYAGGE